jgi:hypothetical protein
MKDISNHVKGLLDAQGFKEWFQQLCRSKGNELWKLVKPMMHQKTTNDWNDMYALMYGCHKLAVEMILSGKEFTFESVDIQARFNPGNMINKEGTMMGISGEDLARRGTVVKLGITPKILASGLKFAKASLLIAKARSWTENRLRFRSVQVRHYALCGLGKKAQNGRNMRNERSVQALKS